MGLYTNLLKYVNITDTNIIEIAYQDKTLIDEVAASRIFDEFDRLTEGKPFKKLMIIGQGTNLTQEARQFIISENNKRKEQIIAEAIVVNSFFQKLSANFYILYLRNIYPTHFFTNKDSAMEWLKRH